MGLDEVLNYTLKELVEMITIKEQAELQKIKFVSSIFGPMMRVSQASGDKGANSFDRFMSKIESLGKDVDEVDVDDQLEYLAGQMNG